MIIQEADFSKSALLIVDMQNDFIHKDGCFSWLAKEEPEARIDWEFIASPVPNIVRLATAFREVGRPIIHIMGAFRPDYSDAAIPGRPHQRKLKDRQFGVEGTWGTRIIDELSPKEREHVIVKKGYGSFHNTPLGTILHNLDVNTCIVTGVTTCVCVSTTTREGVAQKFRMVVISNATAETRKELHEAELKTLAWAFADVKTTDEMIEALKNVR